MSAAQPVFAKMTVPTDEIDFHFQIPVNYQFFGNRIVLEWSNAQYNYIDSANFAGFRQLHRFFRVISVLIVEVGIFVVIQR